MSRRLAAALGTVLALAACASESAADAPAASPTTTGSGIEGRLTVFAAASLIDVFTDLGERLEERHPGLDVQINFAGSSALAGQLTQGAPADVFASADEAQMARVEEAALVQGTEVFAENALVLAVPAGNPGRIAPPGGGGTPSLAELVPADVTMAVCAPEVPCGALSATVLDAAGRGDAPDTHEEDVRAVLTKVQLGEVDAGLVYVSDVRSAGDSIVAFGFREAMAATNSYPIGVLEDAPNPAAGRAFVDLVLSGEGRQALTDAGFLPPR